jgi:antiviral helicase SLH1
MDRVTFEKVSQLVAEGHQVMVFVHARKETVKTAMSLMEEASSAGLLDDFTCDDQPQFSTFRRSIGESRNKEMKLLFDKGFGIHHAGMLRSDRNLMERIFEARTIKVVVLTYLSWCSADGSQVLCCTATLAWGVNLPAHAGKFVFSVRGLYLISEMQSSSKGRKCMTARRAHSLTFQSLMSYKSSDELGGRDSRLQV